MARKIIYLDNAATTSVSREVVAEMNKYQSEEYGNPSSIHEMGERARGAVYRVRKELAFELGCKAEEIVFTSGTTESNNLAFFGLARSKLGEKRKKIVISKIEHSSIYVICDQLKKEGFEIVEIGVDKNGILDLEKLEKEIDKNTFLVSVIHVQNEIGVIQDLRKIGKICKKRDALFHSDAAQSFGKLKIKVKDWGINMLSCGGHKIGGPKGIGLLYVGERVKLTPLIYGGGQEKGLRGGTENVAGIVGMGMALEMYKKINWKEIGEVRNYLISGIEKLGGKINGSVDKRIWDNVNVSFIGIDGEGIVLYLSQNGIYCSTGSACENRKNTEDRILKAIGLKKSEINGSLRFGLSEDISKRKVDFVLWELEKYLRRRK
jgi:cysteine desulfurase